jgi:hypothetical protein
MTGLGRSGRKLRNLLDFTRADAGSANANAAPSAVHQRTNGLQIQVPAAVGHVVGVADPVPELGAPAANFTNSSHKTEISRTV